MVTLGDDIERGAARALATNVTDKVGMSVKRFICRAGLNKTAARHAKVFNCRMKRLLHTVRL